jgi:outer membrane receptor protein involved in Fe transport
MLGARIKLMFLRPISAFSLIVLCALAASAQQRQIRINVADPSGATIRNAIVRAASENGEFLPCPPDDDAFICSVAENGGVKFEITARSFKPFRIEYAEPDVTCCEYVFVLQLAPIGETVVTIARSETRIAETPQSIAVLGRRQLETTAAPTLDEALRQVPGFSIFRRSSSRNANPTTQGVSLRGVGASGASRSVVLFDGVPLNDPFGGWVQWNRVSPIAVETVEVLRGGASSLYGNSSLSGAIGITPRAADEGLNVSAEVFAGSQRSISASAFVGGDYTGWFADVSGGHFQTRGFIPVDEDERGLVDSFAGVRTSNSSFRLGRHFGETGSIFIRHNYFDEARTNGTPAQINRTHSRQFVLGGTLNKGDSGRAKLPGIEWRVFGGTQVYDQTFSAVVADRSGESLTRLQRSPSQHFGFSGTGSIAIGGHNFIGGVEGREVRGTSDEVGFFGGNATSVFGAGGRERTIGAFVKDVFRIGEKIVASGGLRFDRWRNYRGMTATTPLSTQVTSALAFADRGESAWSPSVSILVQATDELSFHTSASRSFRAPTLNELYRGFRVGNVVTNPNENLMAERASNFEAGGAYRKGDSAVRLTAFYTRIDRTISNVTIASTPALITRQRQNAGTTRAVGFEIDAETRVGAVELNAGYLFADSRVTQFPSNTALVDKFIPQVPRHQFTFQTRLPWKTWTFALQGRASSEQFDDDLNQFRLESFFQADAFVSKRIKEKLEIFAAVENFFNSHFSVGRTPVRTVSSPINGRLGIRWR